MTYIKEARSDTHEQLANHLETHVSKVEKWVAQYKQSGIEDLLMVKPKRKGSKIITPQIHDSLAKRVMDGSNITYIIADKKQKEILDQLTPVI